MKSFFGQAFTWFVGVVEDVNDPLKMGRARVRCMGYHSEDKGQIPTDLLPWAQPINGVDSPSVSGLGKNSTFVNGSWVVGFFMDGERAQEPMILGTIAGAPDSYSDTTKGFNDPDGVYPKYIKESDINRLARGTQTKTHTPDTTIGEPDDPYSAQYPHNSVMETRSGHVKEYDDTPDHERIRELHKSGTFYEVHPNGDLVTHVVRKRYAVVASDDALHVKGDVKIIVDGDATINIGGTVNMTAPSGDIVVDGISLVNHTHTDTAGLAAGTTSKPNK